MAKRRIKIEEMLPQAKASAKINSIKDVFKEAIELATEVSKEYPDATDWKDAYTSLHTKAKKLLNKISQFVK